MADKKKTYRINKVATEFNVSWKTIVEHLSEKGFEVESKISAKLDEAMYQNLLGFYQKDKQAKEESQQLEINIRKDAKTHEITETQKPEPPAPEFKPESTIFIKDNTLGSKTEKEVKPEPPVAKKVETIPEAIVEKPVILEPEVKVEVKVKVEKVPEVVKPKVAEKPKEVKVEPANKDEDTGNLKVLGKISIEKPAPKKKTEKSVAKKKEVAPKPKETVEVKKEDKIEEVPENVNTEYKKLEGTTVLGKIVIKPPVKRTKKDKDEPKRKRKRIKGEKVTAEKLRTERSSGREKPGEKPVVSQKEIQDKIKKTLSRMSSGKQAPSHGGKVRQKARKFRRQEHKKKWEEKQLQDIEESKILDVTEFVTANDLANMMNVNVNEIIGACFSLGLMVSINQRLDAETIQIVAEEFEYEVNFVDADETIEIEEDDDKEEDLLPRHPIVTVMGHVDHGKTSLLDHIRNANVIAGEAGGITQHVASYEVQLTNGSKMTFIDTPGHEAFTAMRARGAQVTDIAIIVIAADDVVMPQTKEAISHAQAADVPIVFAINKIDKDGANPDRVRESLSAMNILVEEWGGKFQCQEISAKNGINIEELLEKVSLEAELLELKANPNKNAKGAVLEAKIEKGRGIVASMLVSEGTLQIGDALIAGQHYARVKAMFNERGKAMKVAGPGSPVSILGFSAAPAAGETFQVLTDESQAKEIANKREQLQREQSIRTTSMLTLDTIGKRLAIGNFQELKLIIKADVDGSSEALSDSLLRLSTEEIEVKIIQKSVGPITDNDVLLAKASDAVVIGFQVRPMPSAKKLAESEGVEIKQYSIIYQAIEEIKAAMEGMLTPDLKEEITGTAEVREVFKITKVGTVAGCMQTEGKMFRDNKVRIIREGVVVYTGEIDTLKRFKDDVKEVAKGYECGIQIKNYNDLQELDLIEGFREVEVARKLK
ncbi:MAG: translation initiation factor IF-2 [Bacteroidia bacterium]|jgi:translation initiation factor IF-2|tara:strand:+ start:2569 stop:5385 length:2817 start_codon:yes stop_codon:yes gene_type:complete